MPNIYNESNIEIKTESVTTYHEPYCSLRHKEKLVIPILYL